MQNSNLISSEVINVLSTKVARPQSALTVARRNVVQCVDGNVKSVSSYFKEFRKSKELQSFLLEAHKKGRTFDPAKVHNIINKGDLKMVTDADHTIQKTRKSPARNWSATRMLQAFVAATEIKPPKK